MSELAVSELTKEYPGEEQPLLLFNRCSFAVPSSGTLAIVGPSGSGKSTMLALLGALDLPTSGRILFDGLDVTALSPSERTIYRRERVGFIFQDHCLMPHLTAWENVMLPVLADGRETPENRKRAESLFDRIGLNDRKNHFPGELSGGQCQRLAIARALIRGPQLILADEPTGNLDRLNAGNIASLLFDLARHESVTLVLATHDTALAESADLLLDLSRPGAICERSESQRTSIGE